MKLKCKKFLNFPIIISIIGLSYIVIYYFSVIYHEESQQDPNVTIVEYWEKWSGFEMEALQKIVNNFNNSQNKIKVQLSSVGDMEQKLMLAIAGNNPPDLAGLWSHSVNVFASKEALLPLDKLMENSNINKDDYIESIWKFCNYYNYTWALPTTPASLALHWNKDLFKKANLNPNKPPKTLKELDEFNDKLTLVELKRDNKVLQLPFYQLSETEKEEKNFRIIQLGYAPNIPGWYDALWIFWQHGNLYDEKNDVITSNNQENINALKWYSSFTKKYGVENLQRFNSAGGNFASTQNPFLAGKVAMVLQGVWLYYFIDKYSPNLDWGVAAFPNNDASKEVTLVESDVIVIPKGAKHPHAAFEFIKYLQRPENLELLNLEQRKFSPLKKISKDFISKHPNKYIENFIELSKSKYAYSVPPISLWNEYKHELLVAYEQAFNLAQTPEDILNKLQKRISWKYDRTKKRWNLIKESRFKEFKNANDSL